MTTTRVPNSRILRITEECPGCGRPPRGDGEKWCQICILQSNVMATDLDSEKLEAMTVLEREIRGEERGRILAVLGVLGDELREAIDRAQRAIGNPQ